MDAVGLLVDALGRVRETAHDAVEGLTGEELVARLDADANSIAWLVWHLTRVQDDHTADVAGVEQVYTAEGWAKRLGLPLADTDIGYGHSSADVAAVRITDPALLVGYYDAVHQQTLRYLGGISADDLDRVVDERWDPPVTLAVRLVSIVNDDLQHTGQAAFVRGVVQRRLSQRQGGT